MIDLTGHAALVTGSTHGIGRAIAESLALAGAAVIVHGRDGDDPAEALAACRAHGRAVHHLTADLLGPVESTAAELAAAAFDLEPGLDILVNNAGHHVDVPFERMTPDRFERTMRLNVAAGYFLTQAFARRWVERGVAGRVLFTSSINGRLAEPTSTAYDISKGAVDSMVRTLCVALAPHGIRVNAIAPGFVRTRATAWLKADPDAEAWMKRHTPSGDIPDAGVCGPAAAFLVSDLASHVHGQVLPIDGGMSTWQQPLAVPPEDAPERQS